MLPELKLLKKATDNLISENNKLFDLVKNWDIALDAISDPVIVVDNNYVVKCVNQAMMAVLDVKEKTDLIDKICHKYTRVEGVKGCSCFTNGRFFYDESLKKWFEHQSKTIYDNNGNLLGHICILKDVTEYKRIEDTLRDKLFILEQPFNGGRAIGIEDIIDINILQELQLTFSHICDIACIIIGSNGEPIINPSNFSAFCRLLRSTESGIQKCEESRAIYYKEALEANKTVISVCNNFPQILEAVIPLRVCGKVVGAVCMGQVKYKPIPENVILEYANEIGVDPYKLVDASNKLTIKTYDEFKTIVSFFETFCEYISLLGTKNVQQYKEINKRISVEKKLVESQYRFRDIVSLLTDWVWEIDRDGIYTYCSRTVEQILGYTPEEVIGKTPFDFMPVDRVDTVYKKFNEKAINRECIVELRNWCVTKSGKLVCVSTNCVPIFDDKGKYTGYRGADVLIPNKYAEDRCGKLEEVG